MIKYLCVVYLGFQFETWNANLPRGEFKFSILLKAHLAIAYVASVRTYLLGSLTNEETSSSKSGIHFGHYIVGSRSNTIAHYHAARVTVVLAHAIRLKRWSRGMSVMLKKTLGVTLVTKLRAILLMEADFNATNKILYGVRMMARHVAII